MNKDIPSNSSPKYRRHKRRQVRNVSHFRYSSFASTTMSIRTKELDAFWYHGLPLPPPPNFTPGLVSVLSRYLHANYEQGIIRQAAVCFVGAVHISQNVWDRGWGCGYRNFSMACAVLMTQTFQPGYVSLLDSSIPHGVRNLQLTIENAWKEGFDAIGEKDLKTLVGSRKWVGTADLWVAFSYCGIPVELVDFDLKKGSQHCLQIMLDWIVGYFTQNPSAGELFVNGEIQRSPGVLSTDRMPIILQNNGHSRTVVGYEVSMTGEFSLLVFDPSESVDKDIRSKAIMCYYQHYCLSAANEIEIITSDRASVRSDKEIFSKFKLSVNQLRKKEYQILYFPMTNPLSSTERMRRKVVTSSKVNV